ncbi:hypothetical protein BsWGS_17216 [Bradybaena similaris]
MRRLMWELLLVVMLCVAIGISQKCKEFDVCLTKECVATAGKILRWVDTSVKPCDDFYEFACGGWNNSHFLPSHSHRLDALNTDNHLALIRNRLAEQPNDTDYEALQKAKKFYTSCINHGLNDYSILAIVENTFDTWPLICDMCYFEKDNFDVTTMIMKGMSLGAHLFFKLKVGYYIVDDHQGPNSETHRLYIDKPDLLWSTDTDAALMEEEKYIDIYAKRIYAYAVRFKVSSHTHAKVEAFKIASTEHTLAQIYNSNDKLRRVDQPEKLTIRTLTKNYDKLLNWQKLISLIAKPSHRNIMNIGNTILHVAAPEGLKKVIQHLSTLPHRELANFLMWRMVHTLDSVLINKDSKLSAIVTQSLPDTNTEQLQSDRCAALVSKQFHMVAHNLLYEAYHTPERQKEVSDIADKLQGILLLIFKSGNKWWTNETAYSVWIEKVSIYEKYYGENLAALNKAAFSREFERIMEIIEDDDTKQREVKPYEDNTATASRPHFLLANVPLFKDIQPPHEFQTKYDVHKNEITFSSTAFKPPFLTGNVPLPVDFAGLGFFLAREIIHAFNYMANIIYKDMNYEDWLKSKNTFGSYLHRIDCIHHQYNTDFYGITYKSEEGWSTVYEDIADTAGITLAYETWNKTKDLETAKKVKPLPRVPFADDELFFIQYAQNFCALEDRMGAGNKKDKDSPSYVRVTGSLRNSKDFASVFKCTAGSFMNPPKRCQLW